MNLPGKYTLDRFEKEMAVLLFREDETTEVLIGKESLPSSAEEGDILFVEFNEDDSVQEVKLLEDETEAARQKVEDLLNKLKKK
ncbi:MULTISPECIES: DUF3006 domain-containing protein [Mesobacillus]|uniref:DUF3006 domain-containing protein n=2 Tax=Mesobacillus TaxID=2675231 RepID=A0A0D6ZDI4_9BACI|nr:MULTISPECIES: DUF3006 domain-containing protein [Mesobacillus]KIY23864.1 hypothetical protein UB32_00595 [Mesobacillus subterraneus]MDQ0415488.1 hypothetical protein [Mesobacillus stamsii]